MKRIEKNKMCDDQTVNYPLQGIKPLAPGDVNASTATAFRFKWASDSIDNLLRAGLICKSYLDIGACDGFMAMIAAKKINRDGSLVHVDAVEAHGQSFGVLTGTANLAHTNGLHIIPHCVLFENYKTDKHYDIITAFEILEHTRDPESFLGKIYDLLKFEGVLMMSIPEESGIYGMSDTNPYHYWSFTIQSVSQMLDEKLWHINSIFEVGYLIHVMAQKRVVS